MVSAMKSCSMTLGIKHRGAESRDSQFFFERYIKGTMRVMVLHTIAYSNKLTLIFIQEIIIPHRYIE